MYHGTYSLIGTEMSMFTRKLEAQLRYQHIPFRWHYKTQAEAPELEQRAGTRFIPLLQTPDGWLINDTIAIGPFLNDRFKATPVIPGTPVQRATCFVLEDYLNHWFPRHALHTRWIDLDNARVAGKGFGANLLFGKSIEDELSLDEQEQVAGMGTMMRDNFGLGACEIQGAGADRSVEVHADFNHMMHLFEQHFSQHDFLLGDRACLADFALAGPAKAHFLHDPLPLAWLEAEDNADMLRAYTERVYQGEQEGTDYLTNDEIPETLIPIFQHVRSTYQPFAKASIQAALRGEKSFTLDLGHGEFTARSMKRLNKARQHVADELRDLPLTDSILAQQGLLAFYTDNWESS